jgi:hypothetical protein
MQHGTESALERGTEYNIDVRSRHRALSADVVQFLIIDCEDAPVLVDRGLPYGVSRAEDTGVAGRWEATAMTSREPSTVTVTLAVSGRDVGGNVHFGPPAFDVTLPLVGRMVTPTRLSATIGTGDGVVTFAGTLDADGQTLEGPVLCAGRVLYTLRLARR